MFPPNIIEYIIRIHNPLNVSAALTAGCCLAVVGRCRALSFNLAVVPLAGKAPQRVHYREETFNSEKEKQKVLDLLFLMKSTTHTETKLSFEETLKQETYVLLPQPF